MTPSTLPTGRRDPVIYIPLTLSTNVRGTIGVAHYQFIKKNVSVGRGSAAAGAVDQAVISVVCRAPQLVFGLTLLNRSRLWVRTMQALNEV
jgi:hypothetical protein